MQQFANAVFILHKINLKRHTLITLNVNKVCLKNNTLQIEL
ncbi:hypothetical protein SA930_1360 [Staphylococcus aureus 930918-3]|uniref:Uncharacterized protein n=1 Tax=Staphylococcus aureus (strain COL) TaxID=93062 RepID=A0A0H2WWW9_STAAC|nr:hypothetical protein SACOL2380 [Staphylococcus aureus subsp. aureus COL]EES94996.1 hypothetical protein HMPREF0776_0436 [Staphylococcus aureus subsp. aureus USA300_TCH959]EES96624.1 hypothetical protein HMPREF0774_1676 [Staphylococcus aureus subsp. aureus TCH130]EEW45599.1 hypothetical protein SA930_1360 [Staphylococcus aureus 930918-3]EEW47673.1 hypothetical protein SAD30_0701 [Staphylococcus aureus D30]EFU27759.1 hypothetical protein CGSSa01_08009 [Staphylococcus aureus subsp. aureus CGS0